MTLSFFYKGYSDNIVEKEGKGRCLKLPVLEAIAKLALPHCTALPEVDVGFMRAVKELEIKGIFCLKG